MEQKLKLYMIMLGCVPEGRFTEQHDIFFGIGSSLKELVPHMKTFWPEAKGKIHIDAWREVTVVDDFLIEIIPNKNAITAPSEQLFFINLGGYKENEFEEYHYKMITVAPTLALAAKKSKKTAFYKHCGFKEAPSHIDDQYGIDVDDIYNVADMLSVHFRSLYSIKITKYEINCQQDTLHIGYVKLNKIK
ncbi:DUF1543 domain-containing protein [Flavobacterium sandaracinum]|uniref:DUF1543 domain-containing protein n=1 Tax=Flavobacterium sandaracinum TaxID=2541733 RepID=A0A4R5CMS6_9FLAO|nr:DUF1543 domain-containing protein [Flavobacterium sandaracinum]TDE01689.1 DUF1543 domain-containing protein [Flavobacterium sandaracinum]